MFQTRKHGFICGKSLSSTRRGAYSKNALDVGADASVARILFVALDFAFKATNARVCFVLLAIYLISHVKVSLHRLVMEDSRRHMLSVGDR